MCGLFGIMYKDTTTVPDRERLNGSLALLGHRGPDASGIHREAGLGLAHTRLSLVDLNDRSTQPFWDQSGRYCLVYNGEIYNFKQLRCALEASGAQFRTTGDTEVLLQSLITSGIRQTLGSLEGMFAFAFYDSVTKTLTLARDSLGIKPLVIYQDKERFLFASEVRALTPWVTLQPSPFPIVSYLLRPHGPSPTQNVCFFQHVQILPPGLIVTVAPGQKVETERFATLTDLLDPEHAKELQGLNKNRLVDHVDETLQNAVKQMLFADTPIGALCSGGVDSSLIMSMAAKHHNNLAIFHANVKGPGSEYPAASALSKHLGLDLNVIDVHDQDFIDLIPEITLHYEHPFPYHANSVPFLMVSKLVHQHNVKGVLSGEGADECFLGYPYIAREPFERGYRRQLERLRRLLHRIPKLGTFLWPPQDPTPPLITGMLNLYEPELDELQFRQIYENKMGSIGNNVRTLDLLAYHLRTLLHRNDRLGMAASIEARFPFLDAKLLKLAVNLPYSRKIRFAPRVWEIEHPLLRDKWILRKVAERYLPRALSQRKKLGFNVTAFDRMHIHTDYFNDSFVADYFQLTAGPLGYLLENSNQMLRVKLLLLDVWGNLCLRQENPASITSRIYDHVSFTA